LILTEEIHMSTDYIPDENIPLADLS